MSHDVLHQLDGRTKSSSLGRNQVDVPISARPQIQTHSFVLVNGAICYFNFKEGVNRGLITCKIYANLVILATPVRVIGHQVVCLGHLGGFVAF